MKNVLEEHRKTRHGRDDRFREVEALRLDGTRLNGDDPLEPTEPLDLTEPVEPVDATVVGEPGDLHEAAERLHGGAPGDLHEAAKLLHGGASGDLHEAAELLRDEHGAPPTDAEVIHLDDPAEVLPALARLAGEMWLRAAAWGLGTSVRVSARLARAATDPVAAADLYEEFSDGLRAYAREFLGVDDLDSRVRQLTPLAGATAPRRGVDPEVALRQQGEELLRQAADVHYDEQAHPAYARILTELAPDEARILRLLAHHGPQAMVDVRAANLIGLGSQLVAPAMNMIGAQAGLRRRDRVPAYLNNLLRLGLIFLSDEAIGDPSAYQVLEAQPDVLALIKQTSRAKTIHRSVHLTPFGVDFCRMCLPLDAQGALPRGEAPAPHLAGSDD